jgi:hypothetical protein
VVGGPRWYAAYVYSCACTNLNSTGSRRAAAVARSVSVPLVGSERACHVSARSLPARLPRTVQRTYDLSGVRDAVSHITTSSNTMSVATHVLDVLYVLELLRA